jgi:hypothetical protein
MDGAEAGAVAGESAQAYFETVAPTPAAVSFRNERRAIDPSDDFIWPDSLTEKANATSRGGSTQLRKFGN